MQEVSPTGSLSSGSSEGSVDDSKTAGLIRAALGEAPLRYDAPSRAILAQHKQIHFLCRTCGTAVEHCPTRELTGVERHTQRVFLCAQCSARFAGSACGADVTPVLMVRATTGALRGRVAFLQYCQGTFFFVDQGLFVRASRGKAFVRCVELHPPAVLPHGKAGQSGASAGRCQRPHRLRSAWPHRKCYWRHGSAARQRAGGGARFSSERKRQKKSMRSTRASGTAPASAAAAQVQDRMGPQHLLPAARPTKAPQHETAQWHTQASGAAAAASAAAGAGAGGAMEEEDDYFPHIATGPGASSAEGGGSASSPAHTSHQPDSPGGEYSLAVTELRRFLQRGPMPSPVTATSSAVSGERSAGGESQVQQALVTAAASGDASGPHMDGPGRAHPAAELEQFLRSRPMLSAVPSSATLPSPSTGALLSAGSREGASPAGGPPPPTPSAPTPLPLSALTQSSASSRASGGQGRRGRQFLRRSRLTPPGRLAGATLAPESHGSQWLRSVLDGDLPAEGAATRGRTGEHCVGSPPLTADAGSPHPEQTLPQYESEGSVHRGPASGEGWTAAPASSGPEGGRSSGSDDREEATPPRAVRAPDPLEGPSSGSSAATATRGAPLTGAESGHDPALASTGDGPDGAQAFQGLLLWGGAGLIRGGEGGGGR